MLSILIPTYNTDVTDLIKTICEQARLTKITFEIIFCEDASHMYVEKNASVTKDSHVRCLVNTENLGRTATRSKLAEAALYHWLLFLDADVGVPNIRFIENYVSQINPLYDIIYGGVSYKAHADNDFCLRWKYGTLRESQSLKERQKEPKYVISQNLLLNKNVFLSLNTIASNRYGLDNVFSYQIAKQGYKIHHIYNPVVHLGLEKNNVFLKKSFQAVETLVHYEEKGLITHDFTRLQKSYLTLKKTRATFIFKVIVHRCTNYMEKNLLSGNPSLFLFDLYRLYHYINFKGNA